MSDMAIGCIEYSMKMTMHIDDELVTRVMENYGFVTKTDAVDAALKEMDRRAKLKEFATTGLGLSEEELRRSVDENYDLTALRVAETPAKNGKAGSD